MCIFERITNLCKYFCDLPSKKVELEKKEKYEKKMFTFSGRVAKCLVYVKVGHFLIFYFCYEKLEAIRKRLLTELIFCALVNPFQKWKSSNFQIIFLKN